jgi:hypothetical protein
MASADTSRQRRVGRNGSYPGALESLGVHTQRRPDGLPGGRCWPLSERPLPGRLSGSASGPAPRPGSGLQPGYCACGNAALATRRRHTAATPHRPTRDRGPPRLSTRPVVPPSPDTVGPSGPGQPGGLWRHWKRHRQMAVAGALAASRCTGKSPLEAAPLVPT